MERIGVGFIGTGYMGKSCARLDGSAGSLRRRAGRQAGFNDLKIVEAHQLLNRIGGKPSLSIDFEQGLAIERTIHAIARSSQEGRWVAAA